jgi:gliding motility-associated lipoprotein GldH
MKKLALAACLTVLMMFSACNNGMVFDHYEHTMLTGWDKIDTLCFPVPRLDREGLYDVSLGLRVNNVYPFTGLTLLVKQSVSPSGKGRVDTVNCRLRTEQGKVIGQGVSYYQYNFHVSELHLQAGDSLSIKVVHNMKREVLPGISDVGIEVKCLTP